MSLLCCSMGICDWWCYKPNTLSVFLLFFFFLFVQASVHMYMYRPLFPELPIPLSRRGSVCVHLSTCVCTQVVSSLQVATNFGVQTNRALSSFGAHVSESEETTRGFFAVCTYPVMPVCTYMYMYVYVFIVLCGMWVASRFKSKMMVCPPHTLVVILRTFGNKC